MSGGQAAAARATAAVFVGGRRAGSAVLVGPRYLVTAAHVLQRWDPDASTAVAVEQVELEFPDQGPGGQPARAAASRLELGPASPGADVAVLDLGEDPPGWLPAPVPVWPAARPPGRVQVFGYPLAEGPLNGVWRQFTVAGPAIVGAVQLDWIGDAGTFPGHSGGPVIDAAGHALAGILVEGADRGRFDRFVPVTVVARVWPGLPRPWLMTGAEPGEARSHFTRRARGQRSAARGGDLFRGRTVALDRIREWLTAGEPPGQPLVITGQPGAGKSAVLARAALSVETGQGGPGLAFHARAATIGDFLTALADLTGIDTPASVGELVTSLVGMSEPSPVPVVLDALDEAASDGDRRQITEVLAELAVLPWLRVAVATRTTAVGSLFVPGGLLPALGVTTRGDPNLIDLDSDTYFDLDGLRQFAAALLAQAGTDNPGPPGASWTQYRAQPAVRDQLAAVIAERAGRNFLVAAMAAVPLSALRTITDPAAEGFDPAGIPSEIGEALSKYLDRPDQRRDRDRELLTALAYARGAGLDDPAWLDFAAALGYSASVADLDALRRSPAADYLLQTTATERDNRPVTRLLHQALTDELLAQRPDRPSDERALLDLLIPTSPGGWAGAAAYALTYASDHAASARQLLRLLDDPCYLTYADLTRLPSLLSLQPDTAEAPIGAVVRQVAVRASRLPPGRRARLLALTAAHLGLPEVQRRLTAACTEPFVPKWAHSLGVPHQELTGHTGKVNTVAIGRAADCDIIASAGTDEKVRIWNAATGQPVGDPLTGHTGAVNTVAIGRAADRDIIVSGSSDGMIRRWDATDGQPVGAPLTGHTGAVNTVAIGRAADRDIIVSGSSDGMIRRWDATDGQPIGAPLTGRTSLVTTVAIGRAGSRDIIVSGSGARVRRWDATDGRPIGAPLTGHTSFVNAVALGRAADRDIIVSGDSDGTVRRWDATDGQPIGAPLTGHTNRVTTVAIGRAADRDIIVSGSSSGDGILRIWDASTGQPIDPPLTGHTGLVNAAAIGRAGDRDLIVSGGDDASVRVWDVTTRQPIGSPVTGHTRAVTTVAIGRAGDQDIVVSGSSYGNGRTVRIWDAVSGVPSGAPLTGHTGTVTSVAIGQVGDRDIIVSGSSGRTVRIWDAATRQPIGAPLTGHSSRVTSVAIGRAGDRDIIVSSSSDTIRIWDAATGQPISTPLAGHASFVNAVAVGRVGNRDIIVSGSDDHTVRIWDAATRQPIDAPLTGHTDRVTAVAVGRVRNGDIIVSGSDDHTVRIWDAATRQPIDAPLTGHTDRVTAVAVGRMGNRDIIVSSGRDSTVRIWDTRDGTSLVIDLLASAGAAEASAEHLPSAWALTVLSACSPSATTSHRNEIEGPSDQISTEPLCTFLRRQQSTTGIGPDAARHPKE